MSDSRHSNRDKDHALRAGKKREIRAKKERKELWNSERQGWNPKSKGTWGISDEEE